MSRGLRQNSPAVEKMMKWQTQPWIIITKLTSTRRARPLTSTLTSLSTTCSNHSMRNSPKMALILMVGPLAQWMSRLFKTKIKIHTRWTIILTESQLAEATLSALPKISVELLPACLSKNSNSNHSSSSILWLSNPKSNPISLTKWETLTQSSKPRLLNRKSSNLKCNHFPSKILRIRVHLAGLLVSRCMLKEDLIMF